MSDEEEEVAGRGSQVAGDEEPAADGVPSVPEPATCDLRPATSEELEAARLALIAENDREVDARLRSLSRRGFVTFGVAAAAGLGAGSWLKSRPRDAGLPWPLRRMLETNQSLALAYFRRSRLQKTFSPSRITRPARINGGIGLTSNVDPDNWRLTIEGAAAPHVLTLADVRSFPRTTMITEFRCIEGWSTIVQWTGAKLADVVAKFPPASLPRYIGMETPNRGYYVGLDIESALHPQTLLAYEINGNPLPWQHGAPLRLAIPVKYGVKNIKRIATIRYTNQRPPDYWAEQGYDWYAGH
jgi:DMSO/TMAO reductase YedYZ molybdopterin-dependent catalytic subunit